MKIAIVPEVTAALIDTLPQKGVDTIIYRKVAPGISIGNISGLRIIDPTTSIRECIEYGYRDVKEKLGKIREQHPDVFLYKGYDLYAALSKEVFWALFEDYLIKNALSEVRTPGAELIDLRPSTIWKERIKCALSVIKRADAAKAHVASPGHGKKIAIRINEAGLTSMLGLLPEMIGYENILAFHTTPPSASLQQWLKERNIEVYNLSLCHEGKRLSPGIIIQLALAYGVRIANAIADKYFRVTVMINRYELLASAGVRNILLNAGENEGEGNVMVQVAARHGIRSLNFMNGTKAFDAINEDIQFDHWFMHTDLMKEKVHRIYGVPYDKLPVVGHLLQDLVSQHVYSGMLDEWMGRFHPEFVIAYFSSPLYAAEKKKLNEYFIQFLESHKDAVVFVKRHPSEGNEPLEVHERMIVLPRPQDGNNDRLLFDLFSVADICVSIASTIGYQATWFGIPSISFELREVSRMPFIDNETAFHCFDTNALDAHLLKTMQHRGERAEHKKDSGEMTAAKIIRHLQ